MKCKVSVWAYAFDPEQIWHWRLEGVRGATRLRGVGVVRGAARSEAMAERTARTVATALGFEVVE